jgi:hydroxymethylbilane synthase
VTLVEIKTAGDLMKDRPLFEIGGKGLFTGELDRALLAGEIDVAVHSLKDIPTELPEGISVGAVPEREDPRDVLIGPVGTGITLGTLRRGGRLGTSSLRRMALIRALRPDVSPEELRGNLDTRIRKVDQGDVDGIVVAAAGVHRLGARDRISEYFDLGSWLPAPGQGALAVAVRTDDVPRLSWLRALDHPPSRAATAAERALLAVLGGGCRLPVGALGLPFGGGLRLKGLVAHPDGTRAVRAEGTGAQDDPDALGRSVAEALLARGAAQLLERLPAMGPPPEV